MKESREEAIRRDGAEVVAAYIMPDNTVAVASVLYAAKCCPFETAAEVLAAISAVFAETIRDVKCPNDSIDDVETALLQAVFKWRRTGKDRPRGITIKFGEPE